MSSQPFSLCCLWFSWFLAAVVMGIPARAADPGLSLDIVYRLKPDHAKQRLATRNEIAGAKPEVNRESEAFLAVLAEEWPSGLVPVFGVEQTNRFELRRRPPAGSENWSEPLFFALPPSDEPDAAKIAGHWRCNATRGTSADSFLAWQLANDGDKLSGRFDPNGEYRVATLAGGTFRSNVIELRVEYFMDIYLLTGEWRDGRLRGNWRHAEDSERGTWEASRQEARLPANTNTAALYEWRRPSDDARRYLLEDEPTESGWERAARPLCRVWRASGERGPSRQRSR